MLSALGQAVNVKLGKEAHLYEGKVDKGAGVGVV